MSFISLPTGKLYKKRETRKSKNVSAGYVGRFYRNLADNVDNFLGSDFYGQITNAIIFHLKMFKNTFLLPAISLKICRLTSTIRDKG